MRRLKIENFGPIRAGLTSGDRFINITKVTAFIGSQGSGKSSIAKLVSTFSWIEKALNRGDLTIEYIEQYRRFKKYFAYQQIADYFGKDTFLQYEGDLYTFTFQNEKLKVSESRSSSGYVTPQIMYVPGERNFLSVVENAEKIKSLPEALFTFFEVYDKARNALSSIELPIGDISFQFQKQSKTTWITGDNYKLKLSHAASGFQSYIPLYVVTKYLSQAFGKEKSGYRSMSLDETLRLKQELSSIKSRLNDSQIDAAQSELLTINAQNKYINSCLINIVEEPEQNLFPQSQRQLLYELMKFANNSEHNQLIFTTHSPYLINYLSIAAKAFSVYEKTKKTAEITQRLSAVVPIDSLIDPQFISIYQIQADGSIELLEKIDNVPSDNNFLNNSLRDTNRSVVELMEIEDDSF